MTWHFFSLDSRRNHKFGAQIPRELGIHGNLYCFFLGGGGWTKMDVNSQLPVISLKFAYKCLWMPVAHVFFSGCKLDFVRFRGCHMFVWTLGYPKFHGQSSCSHIYTHVAIFYGYISFISGQIQRYPKMKYGWICISKDLPMISLLWLVSSPHILEHQPSPVHCFQIWGPT